MTPGESPATRSTKKRDPAPRGVFRPRKGLWAIRFTCSCRRVHEESIGPVKGDAVSAYYARKARVRDGWCPRQARRPAMLFKDYSQDFIDWAKKNHRSWAKDSSRLSRVLPVMGGRWLGEITTADVERFLESLSEGERAVAPATLNRYRDLLSGMFKRAKRLGLMASNPVQGIPKVKEASGRVLYLPPATKGRPAYEEEALREALPAELHPLFTVSLNTGLRWSEQEALRWQDVDILGGLLTVTRSKNGYGRTVPINAAVRSVLLDLSLQRKRLQDGEDRVFAAAYRTVARTFERAVKTAQAKLRAAGREAGLLEG